MQWLAMMMSFIFGKMNSKRKSLRETAIEIFEEVSYKSRRIVTLTMTAFGAVIFFCGGFFISLLEGTSQYDQTGNVVWTSTLGAGVGLIALAAVVFATVFLRAWPGVSPHKHEHPREESATHSSNLENALSALIMDYVKEREMRREQKMSEGTPRPEAPPFHEEPPSSSPLH